MTSVITHVLRHGSTLHRAIVASVGLMLAVGASGCAKDLITGKTTLNYYTIHEESKFGGQVLAAQMTELKEKDKKVDDAADAADYALLRTIVARIAAVSHYPEFPYEVHLADVDVANAWCAPGGKIMVYSGLWDPKKGLVQRGNADELAAILAHEIAHATARHVTESVSRNMTIVMAGAVVQSAIAAGGSSQGADLFGQVFSDGMNLFVPSYSRRNEKEADRLGLVYMARAGYDPRVAIELWKRAAAHRKDRTSIYASHPASGERARDLEKYLPEAMALYAEALKQEGKPVPIWSAPPPEERKEESRVSNKRSGTRYRQKSR